MHATPPAPREIELRLALAPENIGRLRGHPLIRALSQGRAVTRRLRSVYFDTADCALARAGIALRTRESGGSVIQTVKLENREHAGLNDRIEYENAVSSNQPAIELIPDADVRAQIARASNGKSLEPIFETDFQRTERLLREDHTELLFDLDVGEIRTAAGNLSLCELELELKRGDAGYLYQLALELQEEIDLRLLLQSKAERGYARVAGTTPVARKTGRLHFAPEALLNEVVHGVLSHCVNHIFANQEPAFRGRNAEGLHQLRVGARRLRGALNLFRPILPKWQIDPLHSKLKWLAQELGTARDSDVFLEELLEPALRHSASGRTLAHLRTQALALREEYYLRVRDALHSKEYARLQLELGRWLARREWEQQPLSENSARLFMPASSFAGRELTRLHRKVRRSGRKLKTRSAAEKHALRIQIKRLRYAGEFFRSLYSDKEAERYLKRLEKLQDVLGHLNDGAVAEAFTERCLAHAASAAEPERAYVASPAEPECNRAAGFVTGWCTHLAYASEQHLRKLWKQFKKSDAFWN